MTAASADASSGSVDERGPNAPGSRPAVTRRVEDDDPVSIGDERRHECVELAAVAGPAVDKVDGRSVAPHLTDHLMTVDVEGERRARRRPRPARGRDGGSRGRVNQIRSAQRAPSAGAALSRKRNAACTGGAAACEGTRRGVLARSRRSGGHDWFLSSDRWSATTHRPLFGTSRDRTWMQAGEHLETRFTRPGPARRDGDDGGSDQALSVTPEWVSSSGDNEAKSVLEAPTNLASARHRMPRASARFSWTRRPRRMRPTAVRWRAAGGRKLAPPVHRRAGPSRHPPTRSKSGRRSRSR